MYSAFRAIHDVKLMRKFMHFEMDVTRARVRMHNLEVAPAAARAPAPGACTTYSARHDMCDCGAARPRKPSQHHGNKGRVQRFVQRDNNYCLTRLNKKGREAPGQWKSSSCLLAFQI